MPEGLCCQGENRDFESGEVSLEILCRNLCSNRRPQPVLLLRHVTATAMESAEVCFERKLGSKQPVMEGIIGALIYGIKCAMFLEELKRLTVEADMVFASIGLKCKAWAYSGEPPPSRKEDQSR